jgi:hypothetical protein
MVRYLHTVIPEFVMARLGPAMPINVAKPCQMIRDCRDKPSDDGER